MTDVARFLDGLRRQQETYRQMAAVAEEQKKLLEVVDVDGLMALVERKRVLLDKAEEVERELAPTKECWTEIRASLDPAALGEVEKALAGTREVLETLVRLENEGRALMERRHLSAGEDLKGMAVKKKALNAYGVPKKKDARFFDDHQ